MNAGPGHSSAGGGRHKRRRGRRPPNEARVARWPRTPGPSRYLYRAHGSQLPRQPKRRQRQQGAATARIFVLVPGGRSRSVARPRADAASRVFAFVEDLFFLSKIQATGQKMNVKVEFVKNEKELTDRMKSNGEENLP